jgi:hypothetical protein
MAAQASVKDAFTFVGGLHTEGGYFITPENTYKEGVNVVPQIDGSLERRNGLDYEDGYQLYAAGIDASQKDLWAFTTSIWTSVAGNGNTDLFVVQLGNTIHFYSAASGTVSTTKKSFTINLDSYKVAGNTEISGTALCSFASTYGKLIITSQNTYPIIVEYDATTDTIDVSKINIQIRDFKGIPLIKSTGELVPISEEYTRAQWISFGIDITDVTYNLYNQGWTDTQIDAYRIANGGTTGNPTNGKYPANTKSWIYGKDSNDDFDATVLNKQDFGNSPAPKGHYVVDPFDGITYAPKACAFFAGRVWYAGMPNSSLLGTVFFSPVLTDITKAGQCYQTNDPTSEVLSDLEDDDGGTLEIPEAGEIVSLQPIGRGILVLATNGIWFVSGIDTGFTAASYSVERISTVGCNNAKSVTVVEDVVLYWNTNGIYAISAQNSLDYTARNISDQKIKTFYQQIPVLGKLYAEGAYNATDKTIYWLYSGAQTVSTSEGRFNKDTILAYDIRLDSWYWFSIDTTTGVIPVSIEASKETNEVGETYEVIAGSNDVIAGTDNVQAIVPSIIGNIKAYKVMALHPVTSNNYSVTFADFYNTRTATTKFKDWYSYNNTGVEQPAYFVTGYELAGVGPARMKTGQYLTVFMKRTETAFDSNAEPINESSCKMQTRWDFTDNGYPGKWSTDVQVYRQNRMFFVNPGAAFDDGYPLVISKNKLRGRGKAVQFKFAAEAGKDMKIVGWTGTFIGNQNV